MFLFGLFCSTSVVKTNRWRISQALITDRHGPALSVLFGPFVLWCGFDRLVGKPQHRNTLDVEARQMGQMARAAY